MGDCGATRLVSTTASSCCCSWPGAAAAPALQAAAAWRVISDCGACAWRCCQAQSLAFGMPGRRSARLLLLLMGRTAAWLCRTGGETSCSGTCGCLCDLLWQVQADVCAQLLQARLDELEPALQQRDAPATATEQLQMAGASGAVLAGPRMQRQAAEGCKLTHAGRWKAPAEACGPPALLWRRVSQQDSRLLFCAVATPKSACPASSVSQGCLLYHMQSFLLPRSSSSSLNEEKLA
jgi:hypothetical protein